MKASVLVTGNDVLRELLGVALPIHNETLRVLPGRDLSCEFWLARIAPDVLPNLATCYHRGAS